MNKVFTDAYATLNGSEIRCKSTFTAENIAAIFSVATLFVLCNPDKVLSFVNDRVSNSEVLTCHLQIREKHEKSAPNIHQCNRWPLTLACGYGQAVPTNRFLATYQLDSAAFFYGGVASQLNSLSSAGVSSSNDVGFNCDFGSACSSCSSSSTGRNNARDSGLFSWFGGGGGRNGGNGGGGGGKGGSDATFAVSASIASSTSM